MHKEIDSSQSVSDALPEEVAGEVHRVSIDLLLPAESPRLDGTDRQHAKMLSGQDGVLPPILVQRGSMRIVDGMHRVMAARLRGDRFIEVRFFDGDDEASFLCGVRANITHGLPLSWKDREAAAERFIRSYPQWSDRAIAAAAGISAKSVRTVRQRATDVRQHLDARIGMDGRVRPVDAAVGRQLASELLRSKPEASLREVARDAGISPTTVRDVRERLRRGEDPVPSAPQAAQNRTAAAQLAARGRNAGLPEVPSILEKMRRDPSVRHKQSGRALLGQLERHLLDVEEFVRLLDGVPPHCLVLVAQLARRCAADWSDLAERIDDENGSSVAG
ncbi:ParB N-terminal domain-containing protein [Streptosporangium sp. CA-135522]|uniref:ParB/RepB/Spo0J family partition protein n=1 Tax=Streptosporangium sp. CA-135522 TaxID=3240072 RepID=UPI003D91DC6A